MPSILFVLSLACMAICFAIARSKDMNRVFWVVMGGSLGPIAIILALLYRPQPTG